jgi:hypothetical protein
MAQTGRRITVYLPPALAERLDRVRDSVNPSRAAQRGLEQAITVIERTQALDARAGRIVDRLFRMDAMRSEAYDHGYAVGTRWAENVATWHEIKQVAQQPDIRDAELVVLGDAPMSSTGLNSAIATLASAALTGAPGPKVYLPKSVPCPDASLNAERRLLHWTGLQAAVREIHKLIRAAMEPPPQPQTATTG